MAKVQKCVDQLGLTFDQKTFDVLKKVAKCERVDGVKIDESELAQLEEMIQEASLKELKSKSALDEQMVTRSSMARLAGDENDLLAESPVFMKAAGPTTPFSAQDRNNFSEAGQSASISGSVVNKGNKEDR